MRIKIILITLIVTLTLYNTLVLAQDLNEDGIINMLDLSIVATAFESKPGDINWNPKADLDGNDMVNIYDINQVANKWKTGTNLESKPTGLSTVSLLSIFSNFASWLSSLIGITAEESPHITKIYIDPIEIKDSRLTSGKTFTIDINVYDVIELYGFDVGIQYNPSVLKPTDIKFTKFLNDPNGIFSNYWEGANYLRILAITLGNINGRTGSGTIANITFQVIGSGESNLDLYFFDLARYNTNMGGNAELIKNVIANDGYFINNNGIQYSKMIPSSGSIT